MRRAQKGNRGNLCTVPWTGPWLQNGRDCNQGRKPRPNQRNQPGTPNSRPISTTRPQTNQPSRTVDKCNKSIPSYTKSVHYSACWVDVYTGSGVCAGKWGLGHKKGNRGNLCTVPWTKAASPAPISAINLGLRKHSKLHKICTLFSMLGGCLYKRRGLYQGRKPRPYQRNQPTNPRPQTN